MRRDLYIIAAREVREHGFISTSTTAKLEAIGVEVAVLEDQLKGNK